ncbi:MAG: ADP-forming succinate--CoA ligase subunit beta, partial [Phycisphaerales bacterium]|nr:ADP-forming succinate--CoA ligase subunit beta [Phycisphaerales bacterium]
PEFEGARMKIHEYQARELLAKASVPVPAARTVETAKEAEQAFKDNGAALQVVKAQVFAGGRGKAGFVKLVKTAEEAHVAAEFMLTHKMISPQTGPEGIVVKKILITAAVDIAREYYVAITLDRSRGEPIVIASAEGGVEIEEVAKKNPTAILKEPMHPLLGLQPFAGLKVAKKIGFSGKQASVVAKLLVNLSKIYFQYDASLVEINPLVVTKNSEVLALDAKMQFDDNALFRHPEIAAMKDEAESDPLEVRARQANLNYIKLDGQIACLVNGAGLAMATMDVIGLFGGSPANFLDVGGGVTANGAKEAFRIILADPKVKGILVNIFGGIAKCDVIAQALIDAGKEIGFKVPLVVRLEGTNVEQARELLNAAHKELPTLQTATDLNDAAEKIVKSSSRQVVKS